MDFLPIISGMLGGAASAGVFKGPIQTLEDWWYLSFGHTMNERAELLRVKQQANIDAYKNDILQEISQIPPEKIKEPALNIIGPAIEASKYYIDDETIRQMFAKLISASMNTDSDTSIHPSYVEIIKQMTPTDAVVLANIKSKNSRIAIANISINYSTGGSTDSFKNLYLGVDSPPNQKQIGFSLSNLSRLGILEISYSSWLNDEKHYDAFKETPEYREVENEISSRNSSLSFNNDPLRLSGPEIGKGLLELTAFGINFSNICL